MLENYYIFSYQHSKDNNLKTPANPIEVSTVFT